MNFETMMPAVEAWFKAGSGLSQCVWQNDRQPRKLKAYGRLQLQSVEIDGHDELTYEEVGAGDPKPVAPQIVGQRIVIFTVGVVSYDHEPDTWAPYHAEKLRTRSLLESQRALLKAGGLAFMDIGPLVVADFDIDDYMVSFASFALRCRVASCVEAAVENSVDVIESAQITTELEDQSATQLSSDLQLNEKEIPE